MPNINELSLAKELIKFPSVTPVDAGAIGFLAKQLKKLGFDCKILEFKDKNKISKPINCLLYTSPSRRDAHESRMPSSA